MIQEMSKFRMIAPRSILPGVMGKVYSFGEVQIDKVTYTDMEVDKSNSFELKEVALCQDELKEVAELEELLSRVEGLLSAMRDIPEVKKELANQQGEQEVDSAGVFARKEVNQLRAIVNKIEEQQKELSGAKDKVEEEKGQVSNFDKLIETFASIMEKQHDLANLEVIGFSVDKGKKKAVDLLKKKLDEQLASEYEIFTAPVGKRNLACILAATRKNMLKIRKLFETEGIKELALPDEWADKSLKDIREILQDMNAKLPQLAKEVDSQIKEFGLKNINRLRKLRVQLQDKLSYYGELPKFAETKFTFIMQGWLPKESLSKFKKLLDNAYGGAVAVEDLPVMEADKHSVPIVLSNNRLIRPFQHILKLFKPPVYGSMDPTTFLAIFFPMIFGMILGDLFYGILIVAVGLFIWKSKKRSQVGKDLGYVFTMCGLSTCFFGIFYGEFLGDMGHSIGLSPILNREHGIVAPLVMAVGFGAFHIVLALTLRVISSFKEHNSVNKHVVEAAGTITVILGLVGALLVASGVWPQGLMTPILVMMGISVVAVFASGGVAGGLEIFGTLGNILSYARIMAIGLSSVILALVANKIATGSPSLAFGWAIAVLLHVINIILGVFGPTVHGLRLHFVESFQKFAKLEGRIYQPFKRGGDTV